MDFYFINLYTKCQMNTGPHGPILFVAKSFVDIPYINLEMFTNCIRYVLYLYELYLP